MSKLLSTLLKRKTVFALVLALTIFGAVYGFAATLGVNANTLSAGNATVASCQTGAATGTYTVGYDTTQKAYLVSSVVVTGLDTTNCNGKAISVTLTGNSGAQNLATITGTVPSTGTSMTLTPSAGTTVSAALVTGVSIAING